MSIGWVSIWSVQSLISRKFDQLKFRPIRGQPKKVAKSYRTSFWKCDSGSFPYFIFGRISPLSISGRSEMASRVVTLRYGAELCQRVLDSNPRSSTIVRRGNFSKTVSGSGNFGSCSPGAAAMMNARSRVCGTPKLPACSTPKVT